MVVRIVRGVLLRLVDLVGGRGAAVGLAEPVENRRIHLELLLDFVGVHESVLDDPRDLPHVVVVLRAADLLVDDRRLGQHGLPLLAGDVERLQLLDALVDHGLHGVDRRLPRLEGIGSGQEPAFRIPVGLGGQPDGRRVGRGGFDLVLRRPEGDRQPVENLLLRESHGDGDVAVGPQPAVQEGGYRRGGRYPLLQPVGSRLDGRGAVVLPVGVDECARSGDHPGLDEDGAHFGAAGALGYLDGRLARSRARVIGGAGRVGEEFGDEICRRAAQERHGEGEDDHGAPPSAAAAALARLLVRVTLSGHPFPPCDFAVRGAKIVK